MADYSSGWVTDIAATSIEQCSKRYNTERMKDRQGRHYFEAEFHVADCTQVSWIISTLQPVCMHNLFSNAGQTEGCI